METHTRLSRHNKFISAENITIFSVSSDDYLHASLTSQSSKCGFEFEFCLTAYQALWVISVIKVAVL